MSEILTEKEIGSIADRVVEGISPEKILLFGSYAWGKPHPGSDLDLFIIQKTSIPRKMRRRPVSDLLRPRIVPIDIFVYTPQEVDKAAQTKGSFVKEILARGKILYEKK